MSNGNVTVRAPGSVARVVTADIVAGSAVVHLIDEVLLPFSPPSQAPSPSPSPGAVIPSPSAAFTSVADAAARNPDLSTLLAAVQVQ